MAEDYEQLAKEPGAVSFSPPKGWSLADAQTLPEHVQVMVVGSGEKEFPPSMNLTTEDFQGSLRDYLNIVKEINKANGAEWKDLGKIRTVAGDASLSQADTLTEWGPVRMMHVILIKDDTVYILTAAALKKDFPKYYKHFFESLRSLRINEEAA